MPLILCPECGTRAAGANSFWGYEKPYCSSCGWNVPAAIESQRALLRQFGIALCIGAAFFVMFSFVTSDSTTLIAFLVLAAVLLAACLLTWKKLKTLTALEQAPAASPASVLAAKENTRRERTATFEHVRSLPRPRPVRLKIVPRVIAVLFPLSLVFSFYFGFQLFAGQPAATGALPDKGLLLLFAFMLATWFGICGWTLLCARRDRGLLADGEVSLATITNQWKEGGRNPVSKVAFTFRDAAGRLVASQATDNSRSLYEQTQTLVFYDPLNSEKHVLAPCAYCRLKDGSV
jgi:uncharacterized protein (DUF983 family)